MKKVVLLEDDHEQANWIENDVIRGAFPTCEIQRLRSEHEFKEALPAIAEDPPGVFVLDVIVRWTVPSPDMVKRPENVKKEGRFRAGLRCNEALQEYESLKDVPVVFHTVLGRKDLQNHLSGSSGHRLITKEDDGKRLLNAILSGNKAI